jgi:hypothetical protein
MAGPICQTPEQAVRHWNLNIEALSTSATVTDILCRDNPKMAKALGKIKTGVDYIAIERKRQIDEEGYTADHDAEHTVWDLVNAASAYMYHKSEYWPWDKDSFKPGANNLVKAGALIAAAIDRQNQPKPRYVTAEEYADMMVEGICDDMFSQVDNE